MRWPGAGTLSSATRVTLKWIAFKAGVHITTVSLTLKDHPSRPATTRNRIKALA
ncbi:MAG: LacI family DNA-binding transcriptional regulator [Opitutus sp.]|nr:LacI family DNA-binding transcriptional regulator [Opitutus sp.]MCS6246208.1 LacI family DNA-binding transcriptional regulator [Opitutus sp.]MCS6275434.1 LacI family DNA-binding transcriptional regulator [Opitutus sp.]MCS6277215.1 LacI family DNA-binding transcriptional regulator [Opitutus sp.]MCS6300337.1 LacI family DNA-binding transcriptional regulator [Opitutus sp.]